MLRIFANLLKQKAVAIGLSAQGVFFAQRLRGGVLKTGGCALTTQDDAWSDSCARHSAQTLDRLLRDHSVQAGDCMFSLAADQCRFATVSLPFMGAREIRRLLSQQSFWRERLSIEPRDFVLKWAQLGNNGGRPGLFLCAAERRCLRFYGQVAKHLGIKISRIPVAFLEFLTGLFEKSACHWILPDPAGVCLVSFQASEIRVRCVPQTPPNFFCQMPDAYFLKKMAEEIENFFLHEAPNQSVEVRIFLLNAPSDEWPSILSKSLPKLVLRTVHPDRHTQAAFAERSQDISRSVLAALSATYRESRKWIFPRPPLPRLNFSPNENSGDFRDRHFVPLASAAILMLGSCVGAHKLLLDESTKLETQLEQLRHTQTLFATLEATLAKRELELGSGQEKLQSIRQLEATHTVGNARLGLLSEAAPRGLWFKSLLLREGDFEITGIAESHAVLNSFFESLEKEKAIKRLVLENMANKNASSAQGSKNMSFLLRGKFHDIPGSPL